MDLLLTILHQCHDGICHCHAFIIHCAACRAALPVVQLAKQPCCYSGRLFSSLFGSHDHHPQSDSPRSHGKQLASSPAAESASHNTQAAGTGMRYGVPDMEQNRQQGAEGVADDESMAEGDADLHTARQAQREALQAEQEALSDSRQSLMQVRESLQHQQPGTFLHIVHRQWVVHVRCSVEFVCLCLCCCLGGGCLHLEAGIFQNFFRSLSACIQTLTYEGLRQTACWLVVMHCTWHMHS